MSNLIVKESFGMFSTLPEEVTRQIISLLHPSDVQHLIMTSKEFWKLGVAEVARKVHIEVRDLFERISRGVPESDIPLGYDTCMDKIQGVREQKNLIPLKREIRLLEDLIIVFLIRLISRTLNTENPIDLTNIPIPSLFKKDIVRSAQIYAVDVPAAFNEQDNVRQYMAFARVLMRLTAAKDIDRVIKIVSEMPPLLKPSASTSALATLIHDNSDFATAVGLLHILFDPTDQMLNQSYHTMLGLILERAGFEVTLEHANALSNEKIRNQTIQTIATASAYINVPNHWKRKPNLSQALQAAHMIRDPSIRDRLCQKIYAMEAKLQLIEANIQAIEDARNIQDESLRDQQLFTLCECQGNLMHAINLARLINNIQLRDEVCLAVGMKFIWADDYDQIDQCIGLIEDPQKQQELLAVACAAAEEQGYFDRAEDLRFLFS